MNRRRERGGEGGRRGDGRRGDGDERGILYNML